MGIFELTLILVVLTAFGLYLKQEDSQLSAKFSAMKHDLDNAEDEMLYHEVLFEEETEARKQQPKLRLIAGGK